MQRRYERLLEHGQRPGSLSGGGFGVHAERRRSPLFVSSFNPGGQPVLCLHGVSAHGLRFVRLAALLPELALIAPDLRGHGRSPRDPPWTVEQHVADLVPLLEGHREQPIVLGHSFGGLVAWELARAMPDRLAALVLVDPAIGVAAEVARSGKASDTADVSWPDAPTAVRAELASRTAAGAWAAPLDVALAMSFDSAGHLRRLALPEAVRCAWEEMLRPLRDSAFRGPTLLLEAARENGRYVSTALVAGLRRQLGDRLEHVELALPHTIPVDGTEQLANRLLTFARSAWRQ